MLISCKQGNISLFNLFLLYQSSCNTKELPINIIPRHAGLQCAQKALCVCYKGLCGCTPLHALQTKMLWKFQCPNKIIIITRNYKSVSNKFYNRDPVAQRAAEWSPIAIGLGVSCMHRNRRTTHSTFHGYQG